MRVGAVGEPRPLQDVVLAGPGLWKPGGHRLPHLCSLLCTAGRAGGLEGVSVWLQVLSTTWGICIFPILWGGAAVWDVSFGTWAVLGAFLFLFLVEDGFWRDVQFLVMLWLWEHESPLHRTSHPSLIVEREKARRKAGGGQPSLSLRAPSEVVS